VNQKLSLSLFFGGLATFLMALGEFLTTHPSWASLGSPAEVGHIIILVASFCMAIAGALGIQLPRNSRSGDRVSDTKLQEIKESRDE
jgi:hypothetical protein